MAKTYRAAIVGCGAICSNHVGGIIDAGQTLAALCDIIPERAQAVIDRHGLGDVKIYTDYEEMLSEVRPDAVHICTPHYLHAPMAASALSKGINVLCEKPVGITLGDLRLLRDAAAASTAQFGVCHQNRYEPCMMKLKELTEGRVDCGFASVVWHRDEAYYRSGDWRGRWETEGGGVLINQALHTLDLLQWICGFPDNVVANTSCDLLSDVIEVEDTASAVFGCENGVRYSFFATNSSRSDLPVHLQIRTKDGDIFDVQNEMFCINGRHADTDKRGEFEVGKRVWGVGHSTLICDFYRCLSSGERFPIGIEEGEKVIRLILSVYSSGGRRIGILTT